MLKDAGSTYEQTRYQTLSRNCINNRCNPYQRGAVYLNLTQCKGSILALFAGVQYDGQFAIAFTTVFCSKLVQGLYAASDQMARASD